LVVIPDGGHMDLVDVTHEGWSASRDALLQMV
jgi:hypothetical protein